jgi:hypothetical protein
LSTIGNSLATGFVLFFMHRFVCEKCNLKTHYKKDYLKHLLTLKHQNGTTATECPTNVLKAYTVTKSTQHTCKFCSRTYGDRTGLWRHNKKYAGGCCSANVVDNTLDNGGVGSAGSAGTGMEGSTATVAIPNNENEHIAEDLKTMIVAMIKINNDFKMQMLDLCKTNMVTSNHHNITNTNNINCINQTFNLNLFLNEQCKDAMNIQDFVNSIQLNMTDLENVGKLGYVEGISNIIIDNLQKTDIYKRPVHCSDIKRETLYIKDDNKWEMEGPEHAKMVNAVLAVEHKNVGLMGEWASLHPKCMNSNTKDNDQYFKLSKIITDGAQNGNISKVIRRVAKNVIIDKTIL